MRFYELEFVSNFDVVCGEGGFVFLLLCEQIFNFS
jgi:hypothetical protein